MNPIALLLLPLILAPERTAAYARAGESRLDELGQAQPDAGWSFTLKPYLWGAGLDGDVGIGPAEVDLDAGFDDLVDHLDIGGMLGFEARPPDSAWALVFDALYVDLGDDLDNADVDVTELIVEFDVAYRPEGWDDVELLAGLRYWDLETALEVGPFDLSHDEGWVDPVLGVRGTRPLSGDWSLDWRVDVGGFGVGSDFSYQLFGAFTRPIGESTHVGLGWRHLDVDYDDDGFKYDTQMSGPIVGLSWGF